MKFFITGATGFVGTYLCRHLLETGHEVTGVGTRREHRHISHEKFHYISSDTTQPGPWQDALTDVDAVVNLAGRTIFNRWTTKYKIAIYDSRILTTRNLVAALPEGRDVVLCSTSAVGYYGDQGDTVLTEDSPAGDDFLARLGEHWEKEALAAEAKGVRVVLARFGIVLGRGGGALEKMVPAFRMMVGGALGNGMQWFPWIHMEDLISAFDFVVETDTARGPFNFSAPNPVRNLDLAKTLGNILKRPAVMPAPAFMIRLVLGEFGNTLLASQRAVPAKLLDSGFNFNFPELHDALVDLG